MSLQPVNLNVCCLLTYLLNRAKSGNWQTDLIAGRSKNAIKFEDDVTKRRPQRRIVIPALQHQAVPKPARQTHSTTDRNIIRIHPT